VTVQFRKQHYVNLSCEIFLVKQGKMRDDENLLWK